MIRFTYGQCGRVHEADDQLAGKTVRCQCRETLRVPVTPLAKPEPPEPSRPARKGPKGPEPWFYRFIEGYAETALALGGIACLLGAAVFVQLGVNVFLGVVLSLLSSGLAFGGMVFGTCSTGPGPCGSWWPARTKTDQEPSTIQGVGSLCSWRRATAWAAYRHAPASALPSGGFVCHALHRTVGRITLFDKDGD